VKCRTEVGAVVWKDSRLVGHELDRLGFAGINHHIDVVFAQPEPVQFIRRLLEKQAVRRMEGGDLSPEQIEELGLALMKLEAKLQELKEQFGLADEDLNLDLGPVGRLI